MMGTLGQVCRGMMVAVAGFGLMACTPGFEGEYADPTKEEIVDDRWNETDARRTSEDMIRGMLRKDWLNNYKRAHRGQKPILIVDEIENRTDEHIDTKQLFEYIMDELINSGDVRFVNKEARQKLLDEIKYQQSGNVSAATAAAGGRQIGADFMLSGDLSSRVSERDDLKTVTYQTALTLTNIETFEIVFSNKKLIKKRFKRAGAGW